MPDQQLVVPERHVFVSYARDDQPAVARLVDDLTTARLRPWWDQAIRGGEDWWERILAEIRRCDVFLYAISGPALSSPACRIEWSYAVALERPVLPVRIDEDADPAQAPTGLRVPQWTLHDGKRENAVAVLGDIRGLPFNQLPDELPPPPDRPSETQWLEERIPQGTPLDETEQDAALSDLSRAFPRKQVLNIAEQVQHRAELRPEIRTEFRRLVDPLGEAERSDSAPTHRADLVLEGGPVESLSLAGAVARLSREYALERTMGTSGGALVGALLAAGYAGRELMDELSALPFDRITSARLTDRVPLVGPAISVTLRRGMWTTAPVRDRLAELLRARGVSTFRDLRRDDALSSLPPELRYRLVVTATDITSGELLYLPWDYADHLGVDPDEQLVADAVTASMSVPFLFEPVEVTDQWTGEPHVLVDGSVLSRFDVDVFDRTDASPPRWPTFGLRPLGRTPADAATVPGWIPAPYLRLYSSLISTVLSGRDRTQLSRPRVLVRTIEMDTSGVGALDFDPGTEKQQLMLERGWEAADAFCATWDWSEYLSLYR